MKMTKVKNLNLVNMITSIIIETSNEVFYKKYKNTNNDSGFDIYMPSDGTIKSGELSHKIKLGIKVSAECDGNPIGYMLLPRSSTGSKTGIRLSNSVGIIDPQYRGELIACVDNLGDTYNYKKGDRLFQLVPFHGRGVDVLTFGKVSETERGDGGFGSTGV